MFVSIVLDPGSVESAQTLSEILLMFDFKKVQRSCWEHGTITEERLTAVKREIDRVTDSYDTLRMYQFPVQNVFAVTELKQKKWRKIIMKPF